MKTTSLACGGALLLSALISAHAQEMPKSLADAAALEKADRLPLTNFYTTPANLSATKPGDLLRQESFAGYALPKGASAVRILYHSLDATGGDVATSGVVLIPGGKPGPKGWPVIAWAHGTSGVARLCAPSAMKDVYYGDEGLMPMVAAGFAVVATDYHGLGSDGGPHQYVNKIAQAHDVVYSIPAARAAVRSLGAQWVVDGHSQGGLAAFGVAEAEHDLKDPDYLGAVSVAGVARETDFFSHLSNTPGVGFYLAFMAAGIHARYPEFNPHDLLSDGVLAHYAEVTTQGCFYYGYAMYAALPVGTLLRPGWEKSPWVHRFFEDNAVDKAPIGGPLFVIAGEADQTVPINAVRAAVKQLCAQKQPVTFRSYPGLDHDPTMEKSTPDQLGWIRARFAGKPAGSNCASDGA
ncbi:MAG TPA: lipase family protein [Steroidobacteraceae bacterium]|nr:lipase family protein [Steroidobacteraceae bacterium]